MADGDETAKGELTARGRAFWSGLALVVAAATGGGTGLVGWKLMSPVEVSQADYKRRVDALEEALKSQGQALSAMSHHVEQLDHRVDLLPPTEWRNRIRHIEYWIIKQDSNFEVP